MHMQPLLIELGTEELPVKALPGLAQAFFDGVIDGLARRGIAFERDDAKPLSTPRRLAVLLPGVAIEQPEQTSEVLGPYLNIALDADGQPTKALQGFAAKAGIDWTQLGRTTDGKGERFVHRATTPGALTLDLLQAVLDDALAAMPIPKPMRWGDHAYGFARPLHWLVALLGSTVANVHALGIRAGRQSRGHRFHAPGDVAIAQPQDYVEALRQAFVLVDPDERRTRVVAEVEAAEYIKKHVSKPVVGFIAGASAPAGKRMGHAGALISGGADTAAAKLAIMEECGFKVTRNPSEMGKLLKSLL